MSKPLFFSTAHLNWDNPGEVEAFVNAVWEQATHAFQHSKDETRTEGEKHNE